MSSARDRGSKRQSNSRRSSRRKDRQKKHHLTQEDIEYLKKNTRYDESEIREWYKGFKVIWKISNDNAQSLTEYLNEFAVQKSLQIFLIGWLSQWTTLKRKNNGNVYDDPSCWKCEAVCWSNI